MQNDSYPSGTGKVTIWMPFANYRKIFDLRDLKEGICQFKNILPFLPHSGNALVLANQLGRALDHTDLLHL